MWSGASLPFRSLVQRTHDHHVWESAWHPVGIQWALSNCPSLLEGSGAYSGSSLCALGVVLVVPWVLGAQAL